MIGFLLAAAHITTCLNCTHSSSAIAIPHVQQPRFTLIHRVYIQQSSSPTAYSLNTRCNCRHSQLALYNYTLQSHYASLADYRRLLKHFSGALPELHYTTLAPLHWLVLLTTLTWCSTHTDWLVAPLRSLKYNSSHTDILTHTDTLSWLTLTD
jgi:hypothetical protein